MNAQPAICPACGELLIVLDLDAGGLVLVPSHPDRINPVVACFASARVLRDGALTEPR